MTKTVTQEYETIVQTRKGLDMQQLSVLAEVIEYCIGIQEIQ